MKCFPQTLKYAASQTHIPNTLNMLSLRIRKRNLRLIVRDLRLLRRNLRLNIRKSGFHKRKLRINKRKLRLHKRKLRFHKRRLRINKRKSGLWIRKNIILMCDGNLWVGNLHTGKPLLRFPVWQVKSGQRPSGRSI